MEEGGLTFSSEDTLLLVVLYLKTCYDNRSTAATLVNRQLHCCVNIHTEQPILQMSDLPFKGKPILSIVQQQYKVQTENEVLSDLQN